MHTDAQSHLQLFLDETKQIIDQLDQNIMEAQVQALDALRARKGRLFILGVGGSAANASHAVNDFRKLCGIEAYAPTDNVSELTARTNDEGWESVFVDWLKISNLTSKDALLVFSVGGGNQEKKVSMNIVEAVKHAKAQGVTILGIVGRDGGETKKQGDHVLVIPSLTPRLVTFHTEAFQAIVWHGLVCHPKLQNVPSKW